MHDLRPASGLHCERDRRVRALWWFVACACRAAQAFTTECDLAFGPQGRAHAPFLVDSGLHALWVMHDAPCGRHATGCRGGAALEEHLCACPE